MNPSPMPQSVEATFPKLQPLLEYLDSLGQRADLDTLRRLLAELDITRDDLAAACAFDDDGYRRNLIRQSKWYEAVCICWKSGQRRR